MQVVPGRPASAQVATVAEPAEDDGTVLVRTLLVGVCGTDHHIVGRSGRRRRSNGEEPSPLVLGHEAVGRVLSAPVSSGFEPGQLVTGIVRRPCSECGACARGDWDFCTSGHYTERGIRGADGFGRDRWRSDPAYLVPVPEQLGEPGVLVEPMSVVCKAMETARYVAARVSPALGLRKRMLVTGAGPIGLLTAAAGRDAGFDVTVVDIMAAGVKPDLVTDLGATYTDDLDALVDEARFDLAVECSGAAAVMPTVTRTLAQAGVLMLIAGACLLPDEASETARPLVGVNGAVVGTVNAGRRHYPQAVETLSRLEHGWLARLITRRVPVTDWPTALDRDENDVKSVVEFG